MRGLVLFALAALASAACSQAPPQRFPAGEVVDLSHAYDANAIFWPTADPFRLEKVADGVTSGGYYYAANNFFTSEHGGTHIDAPLHFAQGHQAVDEIPVDRLLGEAVVVDVTNAADTNADYQVSVADLQRAEQRGPIPTDAIVLIRTGFSKRWPDAARYLGTSARGEDAVAQLHFPGLHPDAAKWLVAEAPDQSHRDRHGQHRLRAVDRLRITPGALRTRHSRVREPHGARPAAGRGAVVVALPMKIRGGSGAPLRAIAIIP